MSCQSVTCNIVCYYNCLIVYLYCTRVHGIYQQNDSDVRRFWTHGSCYISSNNYYKLATTSFVAENYPAMYIYIYIQGMSSLRSLILFRLLETSAHASIILYSFNRSTLHPLSFYLTRNFIRASACAAQCTWAHVHILADHVTLSIS